MHLLPDATGRPLTAVRAMWDDVEAGRLPDFPTMEWYIHTTVDPTLRDDAGHHSSALFVQSVPYDLAGSTWTQALEPYVEHLIGLADIAPRYRRSGRGHVSTSAAGHRRAFRHHRRSYPPRRQHRGLRRPDPICHRFAWALRRQRRLPPGRLRHRRRGVEQCAPTVARHGTRPEVSSASSSAQVGSTRAAPGPVDNRRRIHRLEAPTSLYHEQL